MTKIEELRRQVAEFMSDCCFEKALREERRKEETKKVGSAIARGDEKAYAKAQAELNRIEYNENKARGFTEALAWVLVRIDSLK